MLHLRQGVKFHDGIDAAAVKYNIDRIAAASLAWVIRAGENRTLDTVTAATRRPWFCD